jgi:hypothetical protein
MSVRWQKNGSFGFAKRWLLCRAKPNVPFCAAGILGRFLSVYCCSVGLHRVATNLLIPECFLMKSSQYISF